VASPAAARADITTTGSVGGTAFDVNIVPGT